MGSILTSSARGSCSLLAIDIAPLIDTFRFIDNLREFYHSVKGFIRKDKLKVGVFGLKRGTAIAEPAVLSEKGYIHAVCDYDESTYELVEKWNSFEKKEN